MDKPVTLSVKSFIIRNMSTNMQVSERVLETVINHQFDSAYNALDKCKSLEFSGFGKFFFNVKKAHKKMDKFKSQIAMFNELLATELTATRRRNIELKLETTYKNMEYLKAQLHED